MTAFPNDYLADLPHWVYELLAADGSRVYVGCTSNLAQRMQNHHSKPWWDEVARVETDLYPDRQTALDEERRRIEKHQPTHNAVFTDRFDYGRANRLARIAEAHAAGRPCMDITCKDGCDELAHSLGVECRRRNCTICTGYMPHEYFGREEEELCWHELVKRHGPRYARALCEWSTSPVDALDSDERGLTVADVARAAGYEPDEEEMRLSAAAQARGVAS